jgi:hypothetical protein
MGLLGAQRSNLLVVGILRILNASVDYSSKVGISQLWERLGESFGSSLVYEVLKGNLVVTKSLNLFLNCCHVANRAYVSVSDISFLVEDIVSDV